MRKQISTLALLGFVITSCAGAPAAHGDALEDALDADWAGRWAVVKIPFSSGCGGYYTDNKVRGRSAVGKGGRRFEAGELVTVYKVKKRWGGVDLLVDVVEPFLVPYRDGPFSLYREEVCKVQLEFDLSGEMRRRADPEEIGRHLAEYAERFDSRAAASDSPLWNQRLMDPYPPDYEATLAEYEAWKAHQINAAVQKALDEAIETASRMVDRFEDDEEYEAGFVEGIDQGRDFSPGDCEDMASSRVWSYVKSPPSGESKDWKEGYEEGQKLAISVELARRLRGCFVPIPPSL